MIDRLMAGDSSDSWMVDRYSDRL